jgi:hypothetical protein
MSNGNFRREDIPGINPDVPDMVTAEGAAAALGVPMSKLRARQIIDGSRPPGKQVVNDLYTSSLFDGKDVHISPAH